MDALANSFASGDQAAILAEAKKLTTDSSDKFEIFYTKVMEKIQEKGMGYVQEELGRIQRVLGKRLGRQTLSTHRGGRRRKRKCGPEGQLLHPKKHSQAVLDDAISRGLYICMNLITFPDCHFVSTAAMSAPEAKKAKKAQQDANTEEEEV